MSLRSLATPFAFALALGILAPTAYLATAHAEDAPKKEATTKPAMMKGPRLTKPWSDIDSLTPEQKVKIADIHKKAVADQKKIAEQEEADIKALLTDEQKVALAKVEEEAAAKRKTGMKKPEAEKDAPAGERKEGM